MGMADASTWRTFGEVVTDTATSRKAHPAVLLPDDPTIRALATESRPLMVELRAKPYLDKLDEALASTPAPTAVRAESRAQTPSA